MTGIAPPSVKKYLDEFADEKLIIATKHRVQGYPVYWANREDERFRLFKKMNTILSIHDSGLLNYLNDECTPGAVILFGSASRGEDLLESDIDLFLLCSETKLNLGRYEKALKRKINLLFSKDNQIIKFRVEKQHPERRYFERLSEGFLMYGDLIKVSEDKEKARSMLKMAKQRLEMLNTLDTAKYTSLVIEGYYEVIKELIASILSLDGYKTKGEGAHKTLIDYLGDAYDSEFKPSDIYFLDDLRKIRNRINYDGFFVKEEYLVRNKEAIVTLINKLSLLVEQRLG